MEKKKRKPISKLKYVRDSAEYGKHAAIRRQRPDLTPSGVQGAVKRLDADEVVQSLREQLNDKILALNTKRMDVLSQLLESDNEKTLLGAAKEAGAVVEQYRDRNEGKAKQQVEVHSSHVSISLDFSGKSAVDISGADGFDKLIEGEAVDG